MNDLMHEIEKFLANGGDALDEEHDAALDGLRDAYQKEMEVIARANAEALKKFDRFFRSGKWGGLDAADRIKKKHE